MAKEQASSTREIVLHLLKTKGALTVSELAEPLGITEMAVRRHLNTLERDGLVKTELFRQSMGRPTNKYSLTAEAEQYFPKSYADIAIDFLKTIEETDGITKIDQLFENREQRLYEKYKNDMETLSFDEKVERLASIQNEKGYMVKTNKVSNGHYELIEYNCPIADVAKQYNKACACELSLFKRLVGSNDVERPQCYAKGAEHCVFVIKQQAN